MFTKLSLRLLRNRTIPVMPRYQAFSWRTDPSDNAFVSSGAARGQSGGGSKAGSSRSPFEAYQQLTPEEKRQRAKERRLAKK